MARVQRSGIEPWYEVVRRWVEVAFVEGDSLFTPGKKVWSREHLDDLWTRYVQNFDDGERDFMAKLATQLADAKPETRQLMAEVLYVYYLPMSGKVKASRKRSEVERVLADVTPGVTLSDSLLLPLEKGVAHESQAYLMRKYYQLRFIIEVVRKWWTLDADERKRLLSDPWAFKDLLYQVDVFANQAMRHLLLHMVHPDTFESTMATEHKELIVAKLAAPEERTIEDIDRRLLAIRQRLTATRGEPFSFYADGVKQEWLKKKEKKKQGEGNGEDQPLAPEVPAVERRGATPDARAKVAELAAKGLSPAEQPVALLLLRRLNVALYGPPGTGKTHAAIRVADAWRAWQTADAVEQVTFHPSYGYEDFIEGYRPDGTGKFALRRGIFVRFVDRARKNPSKDFLLVIDELNRGDVARIMGELITLIERDKRNAAAARRFPYSQDEFWVPPNLHLLGTMNTADRSISLLDVAIRRRFAFVEYAPDRAVIAAAQGHHQQVSGVDLAQLMAGLNARLQKIGVERDRAIGHAHFLIKRNGEDDGLGDLRERLRHDVLPLVEEYCYSDRSQMQAVLGGLVSDGVADESVLGSDEQLVKELAKLCETPT